MNEWLEENLSCIFTTKFNIGSLQKNKDRPNAFSKQVMWSDDIKIELFVIPFGMFGEQRGQNFVK